MRFPQRVCSHWLIVLLVAGCSPEVTLLETSAERPGDSAATDTTGADTTRTDTTTVQRAALVVTARVQGFDSVTAASGGMPNGVLPGADVTIQRAGAAATQSLLSDSVGVARFSELLPGSYSVSVVRILTDAERAGLTGADTAINAFGGGREVGVSAPETEAEVFGRASGRGSLVISEVFPSRWLGSEPYPLGTYMEVYNNTDTTIPLDGKLVGLGPFFWFDQTNSQTAISCEQGEPFQNDSTGLWAWSLWRFPGSGQQHPLPPGAAAVLATDAVDHSVVDPRWPDLSRADFEFPGPADADNPAVPNMMLAAPTVFDDVTGHGMQFAGNLGAIWYVADGVDVASLPTANPYGDRPPIRRIPREKVLDVFMSTATLSALAAIGTELCPDLIHDVFDRLPAHFFMSGEFYPIHRFVLASLPNGRPLLLRTQATRNDFRVVDTPTPNAVP